jgi:hypothetical protein
MASGPNPLNISLKILSSGVVYILRAMEGTPARFMNTRACFTFG